MSLKGNSLMLILLLMKLVISWVRITRLTGLMAIALTAVAIISLLTSLAAGRQFRPTPASVVPIIYKVQLIRSTTQRVLMKLPFSSQKARVALVGW